MNRLGYRLVRVRAGALCRPTNTLSSYQAAILTLSGVKKKLNIVVVGANDGRYNDPLYDLVKGYLVDRVNMLLIEPQSSLIPIIYDNYNFLLRTSSQLRVVNVAVGCKGFLDLYVVKQEYWEAINPSYAQEWPIYRAPTGVTSSSKDHVVKWVRSHLHAIDPDVAVEKVTVPCESLTDIMQKEKFESKIGILQIDTEGAESDVIRSANLSETKPALIFFESKHLSKDELDEIEKHLYSLRYSIHRLGADTLAILES